MISRWNPLIAGHSLTVALSLGVWFLWLREGMHGR